MDETGDVLIEDNDFHDNELGLGISGSARIFGNRFHENGGAISTGYGSLELAGRRGHSQRRGSTRGGHER